MRRLLLSGFLLASAAVLPAGAQETGGVSLLPEALAVGGPHGLARPLLSAFPSIGAADLQAAAMPTADERRQRHQNLIARVRGDGGFLDGFSLGQPLALSRQRPPAAADPGFVDPPIVEQIFAPTINRNRTIVRNSFRAPVAVTLGDNNVVQQQGSQSGGTNAQQQIANIGRRARHAGGARDIVAPSGAMAQHQGSPFRGRARHGGGAGDFAMPSGSVVQQQGSQSGGTNAQQQVATIGGRPPRGGASNLVLPSGAVVQRAPQ